MVDPGKSIVPVLALNQKGRQLKIRAGSLIGIAHPQLVARIQVDESDIRVIVFELPEHLHDMVNSAEDLNPNQREQLVNLISEFHDVFVGPNGELGRTSAAKHRIITTTPQPIRQAPRRMGWARRKIAEEAVDNTLAQGVIEPSDSPYSSPIVLVPKKDGSTRFCVDFRLLNDVTYKDAYPLPRIEDIIESLNGAQWFSTLDLASGYWQVEVDPADREKTAFSIPGRGHFHFVVMPFGLANAPATFERMMDNILGDLLWNGCFNFLDDVLAHGSDFSMALSNLREVFIRLRRAGLRLKPSKCKLFRRSTSYLGYLISAEGVCCDPGNVVAIKEWKTPNTVSDIRSFLGTANYYRKFVQDYSTIAGPLIRLTRKNIPFVWSNECQKAFETLKHCLTSAPILSFPRTVGEFVLDTDASGFGIGAVLSQVQDEHERVLSYASKTMSNSQRRYCATHRELLAVVWAVRHFSHFLLGRPFRIRTDHAALKWLINFREPQGMLARWILTLGAYDFKIEHRPGVKHGKADGLSRQVRKCKREDCSDCGTNGDVAVSNVIVSAISKQPGQSSSDGSDCNWLDTYTDEQIKSWQSEDPDISAVLKWKQLSAQKRDIQEYMPESTVTKRLMSQWDLIFVDNGLLYRRWIPDCKSEESHIQLIVPSNLRQDLFHKLHSLRTAGHLGANRTFKSIRRRFYWPGFKRDILRWCKFCKSCASTKMLYGRRQGDLKQLISGAPMERIAIDFLGPLPVTENGNEHILVLSDYFSKWVECFALPNQRADTTADALVTQFFSRFGVPRILHSDQGRDFESKLFSEMCQLYGIQKTRTTPYHPRSDGQVERFNRTIQQMLKAFVNENRNDWDDHLPYLCMAYRSTVHDSTGYSPNKLMLGREIEMPVDVMFGKPESSTHPCYTEFVEWFSCATEKAFLHARQHLNAAATRQKRNFDLGVKPLTFQRDELVWYYYPPKHRKLSIPWIGPYRIVDCLPNPRL